MYVQEIFARFARTSVLRIFFDSENSRCKAVFLLMWNKVIAIKVGLQFLKLLTLIAFALLQYCGCWFFSSGAEVLWKHWGDRQQEVCVCNDKLPQSCILQFLWDWGGQGRNQEEGNRMVCFMLSQLHVHISISTIHWWIIKRNIIIIQSY